MKKKYSIVIPAYNEEVAIGRVIEELLKLEPKDHFEIIVVNDGSTDRTSAIAEQYPVTLISNVRNVGYGYSLKRGIMAAHHEYIVILDADGSYPISSIANLIEVHEQGFDMTVGSREGIHYHGSLWKQIARMFFRILSEFATGQKIPDINSGLRIFRKDTVLRFFHTLSRGFSFTTTITLAFMLNDLTVEYVPIPYQKREGTSKVRYIRDTLRSTQIIVEAIVFYNPIKIYLLCAGIVALAGIIGIILSFISPILALLVFLTVVFCILTLGIGFLGVFLKFMQNDRHDRK